MFSETNREYIKAGNNQLNSWKKAVELGFRIQYNIPNADLSLDVMAHSAFSRYETIIKMLEEDLRPVIELRNKIAHGAVGISPKPRM